MVLAARPSERLDAAPRAAGGARLRGRDARRSTPRALDTHADVVRKAFAGGDIDVAVVAFGLLGDNEQAWTDVDARRASWRQVNYTAAVSVGVALAERMREQGHGVDRRVVVGGRRAARRSNFVYGSTKAGLDAFYTGLTEALRPYGVSVTVVRPGFVHTRMTEGMKPAPLSTTPEAVRSGRWTPCASDASRCGRPAPMRLRDERAAPPAPRPVFRRLPV